MSEQKFIAGPIEGYKATDADMKCRGKQYTLGEVFEMPPGEPLSLCENGYHFCKHLSGVYAYYPYDCRVFKVVAWDVLDLPVAPGADYKLVCRKIQLVEEVKYGEAGDRNTGNGNTGDMNTGDRNTGHMNTGHMNTGNRNTGHMNTGNGNTGDMNTGNGNACNKCSDSLCTKPNPLRLFDKIVKTSDAIDWDLVGSLSEAMLQDEPIDPVRYLSLPNATVKAIKKLHDAHIARRKEGRTE
jgi:hypothetical protein